VTLEKHWNPFSCGLRPGPRCGAHDAPLGHLLGWEARRSDTAVFPLINVFWQDVSLRQKSQRQAFCDAWKAPKSFWEGNPLLIPHSPRGLRPLGSAPLAHQTSTPSAPRTPFPTHLSPLPSPAFWIHACYYTLSEKK